MFHLLTNALQTFVTIIRETNSPDVTKTFRVSDATTTATNEGFNLHPAPALRATGISCSKVIDTYPVIES